MSNLTTDSRHGHFSCWTTRILLNEHRQHVAYGIMLSALSDLDWTVQLSGKEEISLDRPDRLAKLLPCSLYIRPHSLSWADDHFTAALYAYRNTTADAARDTFSSLFGPCSGNNVSHYYWQINLSYQGLTHFRGALRVIDGLAKLDDYHIVIPDEEAKAFKLA